MRELMLSLPTVGGVETFDMRSLKLVVRTEMREMSCIYIIDNDKLVYKALNRGETQPFFNSALVLVGKFLSDNPSY